MFFHRSQLSISSEPTGMRALSCQSSLEPSVPEESPEQQEEQAIDAIIVCNELSSENLVHSVKRPTTLKLNCGNKTILDDNKTLVSDNKSEKQKFLYRSNSSRMYKRPKPKLNLNYNFDKIYFISSNKDDEFYDSIDVIDERRNKNFKKSGSTGFYRSSTVIYSEYCSTSVDDNTNAIESILPDDKVIVHTKREDGKSNGHIVDDSNGIIESIVSYKQQNDNDDADNGTQWDEEISKRRKSSIECHLTSENGINDVIKNSNKKRHISDTGIGTATTTILDREQTTITVQAEIEEFME